MARSIAAARKASGLLRCRTGSGYGYAGKPTVTTGDATWRHQFTTLNYAIAWCQKYSARLLHGSTSIWAPTDADAADYARYIDGMYQMVEDILGRWVYWQVSEWNQSGASEMPYYSPGYVGALDTRREPAASVLERHLNGSADRPCGLHMAGGSNGTGSAIRSSAATSGGFSNGAPGTLGSTYTYESLATFRYIALQSPNWLLSLSYRWERLQQTLRAALDTTKLGELQTAVANVGTAGLRCSLDMFNYGAYWLDNGTQTDGNRNFIGATNALRLESFGDFYYRMATAFPVSSYPQLFSWTLMDEPGNASAPTAGCRRVTTVSDFEAAGIDSWQFEGGSTVGLARDTTIQKNGAASLSVTANPGAFGTLRFEKPWTPGGTTLNAGVWLWVPSGAAGNFNDWYCRLYVIDNGGNHYHDTAGMQFVQLFKGQWNFISGNFSGLTTIARLGVEVYFNGGADPGSTQLNLDEVFAGTASRGTYWEAVMQQAVTAIRAAGDLTRRITLQWWGEFQSGDPFSFWHDGGDVIYDPAGNVEWEAHWFPDYNNAGGSYDYAAQITAAQADGW